MSQPYLVNTFLGIRRDPGADEARLVLQESAQYKNHVNTVHASVQFALGEAASGDYLWRRFHDITEQATFVPVVRKADVKYKKPAQGEISATAQISDEMASQTRSALEKKGRAIIPVTVTITDSTGNTTMTVTYAWFVQKLENPTSQAAGNDFQEFTVVHRLQ